MSDERNSPTYIGRASCGHIRMAVVDGGGSDVARWVADGIREGLIIERTTSAAVRAEGFGVCDVCEPPRTTRPGRHAVGQMGLSL